ncbi:MAG: FAD-dependent monooxygenase, partial [Rhodospirillales bacterium]|nr:FAD-dependent monooxygenase [Rhodospirillales bacterium]
MHAPLIVGGGPAGSAAAIRLAMAGLQPTLLERSREPEDKVCGDFLSGGSLAALRSLGLDPAMLGGHPIRRVRLLQGERTAEAALPFAALGVSRRHLDAVLLEAAAQRGTLVRRGERLRGLSADGRVARLTSGESLA